MTARAVTVDLLTSAESTSQAALAYIGTKTWYSEELDDAGAAEVVLPDAATGATSATTDMLVRFKVAGTADFTGRIESVERVVKGLKPSDRLIRIRARDWLAEFDDAVVEPPLGVGNKPAATVVRFDWTHPDLDRTGWTEPVFLGSVFTADDDPFDDPVAAPITSKDGAAIDGWPDVFTGWIWSDDVDLSDSHAAGTSYFYLPLTLAAGPFLPIFTADDYGELALDGVVLDKGVEPPAIQWRQARACGVDAVTSGTHHICIKATNDSRYGTTDNPGAVAFTAYQDVESLFLELDNVVARTGLQTDSGDPILGGDWLCLDNPTDPPGFTWGHAFRLLFDAAQDAGCLTGWTLGFDDDEDTDGTAWPVTDEITARVNSTLLEFLRQSHDRGLCDFRARPGSRVLDAWVFGDRGTYHTSPGSPPSWGDTSLSESRATRKR